MRINKYYIVFAIIVIGSLLTGCKHKEEQPVGINKISFSKDIEVNYNVGSQYLLIETQGSWSVEITYGDGSSDWCELRETSGSGLATIKMTIDDNNLDVSRLLVVKVKFVSETLSLEMTQKNKSESSDNKSWLELPAYESNNTLQFVTHYMPNDPSERNFSILYDTEQHTPIWVAYTLHTSNVDGDGYRTNDWNFDPKISEVNQPNLYEYYSGYDRGHMLPSASRLVNNPANAQTFYFTNIAPQLGRTFNQGKWATIEGRVRGWKGYGSDTLYVVTGAVIRTVGGDEPIVKVYTGDGKDYSIRANYFYKALLHLKNGKYKAMAIWLEHKATSGGLTKDDIISIDELEKLTGIDFFTNLRSDIQTEIEDVRDPSEWGVY